MLALNAYVQLQSAAMTNDATAEDRAAGMPDRIRASRHHLGISAEHVARRVDVSTTSVLRWETGTSPASHYLPALADALGVSIEWLLTGEGAGPGEAAA